MRNAVEERRDTAVVTALAEFRATVGLVRHPGGTLKRRPFVPVADVEKVEHAAHVVLPAVTVERGGVAAAVGREPLGRLRRQVHVHRLRDRWEEEGRRRRVMVDEHLWVPAQDAVHHRPYLGLALGEQVAVHVEAVVAVAARDAPGLVLLERPRVIGADADGVVPGREALMPIGVRRWVEDNNHRLQDLLGLRFVRRGELIGDLHGRLESRRFVAVNRVVEHRDGRALRRDRGRPPGRRLARIHELRDTGPDLIEFGEVRRIRNDQGADGPVLARASPRLDSHAVGGGGDQGVEIVLHHCVHGVLAAGRVSGDCFGARHGGPIGAAGVEVERLLGGQRGCQRHHEQQGEAGAHDVYRGRS